MKYSVIMPTYNCEKYVEEAIKSVLCQSFSDFELIIIDDGSSDNTVAIATAVISGDNRARIITKEHAGVSAARNRGIDEAKGEYLLFIDGDDTWNKDLILKCNGAISDKDMLIFGILSRMNQKNGEIREFSDGGFDSEKIQDISITDDLDAFFSSYNVASPCNKVYKKELVQKNKIRFSSNCCYLEDLKFNLDYMSQIDEVRILYMNLYYYRRFEENQVFKRAFKYPFQNADLVCDSATEFLMSKNKTQSQTQILNNTLLSAYFNEFNFWTGGEDKKRQIEILRIMNKSKRYSNLLKNTNRKACKLLRVFNMLNLNSAQLMFIKKRFL